MSTEVRRLYTLRQIQRVTGIHWPTLIEYSRDPRVQKHRVDAEPYPLWRHRAIAWFLKFRDWGKTPRVKEDNEVRLEHTEEGVRLRLEADGAYEYDAGAEADAAAGSVEDRAWSPFAGAAAGRDPDSD